MSLLKDIPIRNKDILDILNQIVEIKDMEGFEDVSYLMGRDISDQGDEWTGENYMNHVINVQGDQHEGFPDYMHGRNFKPSGSPEETDMGFRGDANWEHKDAIRKKIHELNNELLTFLGCRNNALFCFYPENGFISWHNNWNAPGYNLIFTWSENGNGWFKHVDPHTKRVITHDDVPGWQLKAGYFGHHEEKDKICYHAAKTECKRITVSFIFSHADMAMNLQDDVIAEITEE